MVAGERGATRVVLAHAEGLVGECRGMGDVPGAVGATTRRLPGSTERWRVDVGVAALAELVAVLLRARSPEARELARAIVRSHAQRRLEEGDAEGFREEVAATAVQLWPAGSVPFPVSWALQATGILQDAHRVAG